MTTFHEVTHVITDILFIAAILLAMFAIVRVMQR